MASYFLIDGGQLAVLERIERRMYSQKRLDAEEMRDLGHALESVVRTTRELEVNLDDIKTT